MADHFREFAGPAAQDRREGMLDPAVAEVRRAVRLALSDVEPGALVLVACSGGADSTALAAATVFEGRKAGWQVGAAVVDHGLQPGSAEVAATVAERLRALGCEPTHVLTVQVGRQGGPEAAARDARYAALREQADRYDGSARPIILLGHTLDDQAETVLLGLARGSGLGSIAGMGPQQVHYRRPLLGVRRSTTLQACLAEGLEVWHDPHNDDRRFTRVRVRRDILPLLEQTLGPGVTEALARTGTAARLDSAALREMAEDTFDRARIRAGALRVGALLNAQPALRRRAIRLAAVEAGCPEGELFAVHVDEVERLLTGWHGQQGVDLPGHVRASRHTQELRFERRPTAGS